MTDCIIFFNDSTLFFQFERIVEKGRITLTDVNNHNLMEKELIHTNFASIRIENPEPVSSILIEADQFTMKRKFKSTNN